jgi:hypothetical protein
MSMLSDPAKFTASQDGRILVEFIDLPRFATDGKDEREALGKPSMPSVPTFPSACPAGRTSPRPRP